MGRRGNLFAMVAAAMTALASAGCGGGGGGTGGSSGGGAVKSSDYWYQHSDTTAVFSETNRYGVTVQNATGGIVRLVPTTETATGDGRAMGWVVQSVSSGYPLGTSWAWATARDEGIYTGSSSDPRSVGELELELPATLTLGSATTATADTTLYDDRLGVWYPARMTATTVATRIDSLALGRFSVSDVVKVEKDFRYVPVNDIVAGSTPVIVAKETIWYGRGLGPVKSEFIGPRREGEPVQVEGNTELRGFRSPTRAIGALPGLAIVDRKTLAEAVAALPGPAGEAVLASSVYADQAHAAGGTSGFMVAARFASSLVQPDPLQPASPGPEGLLTLATDAAGRRTALRPWPLANPVWPFSPIELRGLAFDGSRYWLLGQRKLTASDVQAFLVRISESGELLDEIDPAAMAGCEIRASSNAVLASNHQSVVIADAEYLTDGLSTNPLEPVQYVRTSRIRWCAYDLQRQRLVSGLTPPVESPMPSVDTSTLRLTVSDTGTYVVSMSTEANDVPSYVEIVLDANGFALEWTPQVATGRAPRNFGDPVADRWPDIVDLGDFASLAPFVPDPGVALSGAGSLAIPHITTGVDAALTWSVLVPEREGW